ncbi:hypothetical protein K440DRAFT_70820 [Wilcoxina mikolae CBS 423.85]|nr:hypothetical protein K440DRAFT_70820 [Wilcoxina mikolae CBS 423.85]
MVRTYLGMPSLVFPQWFSFACSPTPHQEVCLVNERSRSYLSIEYLDRQCGVVSDIGVRNVHDGVSSPPPKGDYFAGEEGGEWVAGGVVDLKPRFRQHTTPLKLIQSVGLSPVNSVTHHHLTTSLPHS